MSLSAAFTNDNTGHRLKLTLGDHQFVLECLKEAKDYIIDGEDVFCGTSEHVIDRIIVAANRNIEFDLDQEAFNALARCLMCLEIVAENEAKALKLKDLYTRYFAQPINNKFKKLIR